VGRVQKKRNKDKERQKETGGREGE